MKFTEVDIQIPVGGRRRDSTPAKNAVGRLRAKFDHVRLDQDPTYTEPYLSGSGYSWTSLDNSPAQWWVIGTVVYPQFTLERTEIERKLNAEPNLKYRNERKVEFTPILEVS